MRSFAWLTRCVGVLLGALMCDSSRADPSTLAPEQSYDRGDLPTARALGMGGAQNALGVSTTGLFYNPANLPFARVFHIEAFGGWIPEARRGTYGGAIVDSVLNSFGLSAGFAGSYSHFDADGMDRRWTDLRTALALPLGEHFALGVTGRYLRVLQPIGRGPLGNSLVSGGSADAALFNNVTLDAGMTIAVIPELRIGVVGHNLTTPGTSLAPTTLATGIGYGARTFSVEAGSLVDFTTFQKPVTRVMAGGEYFFVEHVVVRAGYRYEHGWRTHSASLGGGYIDRKWSIELGAQRDLAGDLKATQMVLSLRYFYDAVQGGNNEPDGY